jgi:hypothetical protein
MDRLPAVLQNEIWDYVQGDRAYWKRKFSFHVQDQLTDVLGPISRATQAVYRAVTTVVDIVPELVAPPVPLPRFSNNNNFNLFMEQIQTT